MEFPQGKEEICKQEVVESQGEVAESRQIDLQKQRPVGTVRVWLPCGLDQRTGRSRRGKGPEGQVRRRRREGPRVAMYPPGHHSLCLWGRAELGWTSSLHQPGWAPTRPCLGVFSHFSLGTAWPDCSPRTTDMSPRSPLGKTTIVILDCQVPQFSFRKYCL